ncbi:MULTISPECIES: COG3650 family protein [Aerosakkonema]|uniref:COG3650 family protein n=1 Tax=Aerosakkonema TaxID=1246629 RepID=UPI0035BB18EE
MKSLPLLAIVLGFVSVGLGMSASLASKIGNSSSPSSDTNVISQTTPNAEEFIARGTEPFWNVTVNRRGIVYSTPDVRNRRYPYTAPLTAMGRPADLVRVYRLNGQPSGVLVIKKVDSCSDGMSDNVYPYDATLILGNQVLEGCAQRR